MMKKRMMSLLLSVAMLLTLIPAATVTAAAVPARTLYIADGTGTETKTVTESSAGAGWSYDAAAATLTLDGFNGSYIESDGDLTIKLSGTNRITPNGDNEFAISTSGVLTIDKTTNDETDKLVIENTALTTNYLYAISGNGTGLYGSVQQVGGTVEINLKSEGYATLCGSGAYTLGGDANLKVNVEGISNVNAINCLKVTGNADADIYVKATGSNAEITAVNWFAADGTGTVNITAESATPGYAKAVYVGYPGDIDPKLGGTVTLNGKVAVDGRAYYQPAGETVVVTPAEQMRYGSYTDWFCCDAAGTPITHMTFTGTDNVMQPMGFTGETFFAIPAGKVGTRIDEVALGLGITGGNNKTYLRYDIIEGAFPKGISMTSYGYISGAPTEECEAGTVKIRAYRPGGKDSPNDHVDFVISYGAMTEPPKYLTINDTQYDMSADASGSGWSYSMANNTLTLAGFNGRYIAAGKDLTIKLSGTNRVTPNGDKEFAISTSGVLTIDKTTNDETDKLVIENTALTTNYLYAISGNGTGLYGSVQQVGGTVEINLKSEGYATLCGSGAYTLGGDANLKVTVEGISNVNAINRLKVTDNADADIYVKATGSNAEITAVNWFAADGTGTVNITAESATPGYAKAVFVGYPGDIDPKLGGTVTLNGKVAVDGRAYYQPAGETVVVTPAKQMRYGSYADWFCCDAAGTPITHMIFTGTDNVMQPMGFTGEAFFAIQAGKVGTRIDEIALGLGITGGNNKTYLQYDIIEGAFPKGISMTPYGYISGTPTEECEAGTVKIRAYRPGGNDKPNDRVDFVISYGAMTVSKPVTGVTLDKSELILNVSESKSLTAAVQPGDATITTVRWSVEDSSIAGVSNEGTVTGRTPGKTTVTATTVQGAKTASATVYVKEKTPSAGIGYYSEQLTDLVNGASYTVSGSGITAETFTAEGTSYPIKEAWLGKTISIVRTNAEAKCCSDPQSLTIPARPAAPTAPTAENESYDGASDGKITGVDNSMEYRKGSSGDFRAVSYTTITGCSKGAYEIRYRATGTSFASKSMSVTIGTAALNFADKAEFDVPSGTTGTAITAIDVSGTVTGGKKPYTFTLQSGPEWLKVSGTGSITGTRPSAQAAEATAVICVTDAAGTVKTITIAVGAVTKPAGCTVSGTLTSFGSSSDNVTVKLIKNGEIVPAYEATFAGSGTSYSIENVAAGTYTMTVAKKNHVTRAYTVTVSDGNVTQAAEIWLLGDVTGDGEVNIGDHQRLFEHLQGIATITDPYQLLIADINADGTINIGDHQRLFEHLQGIASLYS